MQTTLALILSLMVSMGGGAYQSVASQLQSEVASLTDVPSARAQEQQVPVPREPEVTGLATIPPATVPLIIAGEGGPSGSLFARAAETFRNEQGGEIMYVHSGDEMLGAMRRFVRTKGRITKFVYFGHGNQVGLYVNQGPGNGALYANDPAVNTNFMAASIYSLKPAMFAEGGEAIFFGCNLANGYPEFDTIAERFANHFRVKVVAMRGPTEFSRVPDKIDPFPLAQYLPSDFHEPVYMVASSEAQGAVEILPATIGIGGYKDVFEGMEYADAIKELSFEGLQLSGEEGSFHPYRNITYEDAQAFCRTVVPDAPCTLSVAYEYGSDDMIRNLHALKMLTEAYGFRVSHSLDSHLPFLRWAWDHPGLLTRDFDQKKWYTRAEMAELTVNYMRMFGK